MKDLMEKLKSKYWKWRIKSDRGRRNFIIAYIANFSEEDLRQNPLELDNEGKSVVWEIMRKCHILLRENGGINNV